MNTDKIYAEKIALEYSTLTSRKAKALKRLDNWIKKPAKITSIVIALISTILFAVDLIIHFHGLRHTFSNMLFEMNENPKVIQQLLGHRDVKTTITVYNSVDSEYVRQTTEKFNEKVKEEQMLIDQNIRDEVIEERKEKLVKDMTDDEFDDMLQKLMEERQERKRKKQSDMEM